MILKLPCSQCFQEGLIQDQGKEPPYVPSYPYWDYTPIELDKWPLLEYQCKKGHKHRSLLSIELYELLFQQATYCIMDGYYREAIGTYHAALERFFEYAVELICLKKQNANFQTFWKRMDRQSERQLGAYYAAWTIAFNEVPEKLDENKVKIRNSVVHKGELVSKKTALSYGQYVFNYIKKANQKLELEFGDELIDFKMQRLLNKIGLDLTRMIKEAIVIEEDGKKQYEGIGGISVPCFITDENIKEYKDCFVDKKLMGDVGLLPR